MKHKHGHTYEEQEQGSGDWRGKVAEAIRAALKDGWKVEQVFLPKGFTTEDEIKVKPRPWQTVFVPLVCHADVPTGTFMLDKYH